MKVNFKHTKKEINFNDSPKIKTIGRPQKKENEKSTIQKNLFFTPNDIEKLEELKRSNENYSDLAFSVFLKKLIKKGMEC